MTDQSEMNPMERFWLLLKPDKKEIRNVYLYAIVNGLVYLTLPLGIQAIINLIQVGSINTSWIVLVAIVILGVAVNGMLQIYQLRITEHLQQKIFVRAAFEFVYRIPRIKLEKLYKEYAPELMNRFFDIISVQKGLSKILLDFTTASVQIVIGLLLLSLYHPFFILFSIVLVIFVYAVLVFTGKKGMETSLEESKFKYKIAYWLQEVARTNITFKLSGKSTLATEKMNGYVKSYVNSREKHFKVLVTQYSLMVLFKVLVATGLLAIGGILVMEGQMNIGQFVASEIIVLLIMGAVEKLNTSIEVIYDVLTSLEKIGQVTDLELDKSGGIDVVEQFSNGGITVEFDNVSFGFPGEKTILRDISFKVDRGEKVLIYTDCEIEERAMLYNIAALYQPISGNISYNGLVTNNIDLDSFRHLMGDAISRDEIFRGSILENITLGRSNVDIGLVTKVTELINLTHEINEFPKGFSTILNPDSASYTTTFIQKMILARAIVGNPKLILLQDCAVPFDSDMSKLISILEETRKGATVIIGSTNSEVAQHVDKVIVLKKGSVAKIGNYSEVKELLK